MHYATLATQQSRSADVFGALSELLVRLSGTTIVPFDQTAILQDGVTPFTAILQSESDQRWRQAPPSQLIPYYRGSNDWQQEIYEFYDSHNFIPAVLASGCAYRVVSPQWLKQKFVDYLGYMREMNIG